jgi:hypothetical protein
VTAPAKKGHMLEQAGYAYGFDRMVYFNPKTRKAFSVEFVEDHSESEIQKCIREKTGGAEWRFYFNSPPSEAVKRELESVLS